VIRSGILRRTTKWSSLSCFWFGVSVRGFTAMRSGILRRTTKWSSPAFGLGFTEWDPAAHDKMVLALLLLVWGLQGYTAHKKQSPPRTLQ